MTALLLLAVAVLIAINGFFVAAEFGLVRSRRASLQELADEGSAGARRAVALHDDLNEYLSACQFGITLASLGIGFLGEPAIATIFEPLFGSFSHGVKVGISVAIAYIIVTGTHVVLGEQVPKIYSIIHPDRIAILVSRPLTAFDRGMKPFISLLNMVSNAILRLLRVDPNAASEEGATPEELRILIGQGHASSAPSSDGGASRPARIISWTVETASLFSNAIEHSSDSKRGSTATNALKPCRCASDSARRKCFMHASVSPSRFASSA